MARMLGRRCKYPSGKNRNVLRRSIKRSERNAWKKEN